MGAGYRRPRETRSCTAVPAATIRPAARDWLMTRPFLYFLLFCVRTRPTEQPARTRARSAPRRVRPRRRGTEQVRAREADCCETTAGAVAPGVEADTMRCTVDWTIVVVVLVFVPGTAGVAGTAGSRSRASWRLRAWPNVCVMLALFAAGFTL